MSKPVLFFSPNCNYCINLWKNLKSMNYLDKIIKINVNKSKPPDYIKNVPTLIVEGRQPLTGESILMYFKTLSIPKKSTSNVVNSNTMNSNNSPNDYLPCEMSGNWSDNYSYIDNSNPIRHSYSFLDTDNKIPTVSEKIDNSSLNNRLEQYKKERNNF